MTRRKLFLALSLLFSILAITLSISDFTFVEPANRLLVYRWIFVSLSLMFLAGGLNRYIDKRQGGLMYIGVGLFTLIVNIITSFAR